MSKFEHEHIWHDVFSWLEKSLECLPSWFWELQCCARAACCRLVNLVNMLRGGWLRESVEEIGCFFLQISFSFLGAHKETESPDRCLENLLIRSVTFGLYTSKTLTSIVFGPLSISGFACYGSYSQWNWSWAPTGSPWLTLCFYLRRRRQVFRCGLSSKGN